MKSASKNIFKQGVLASSLLLSLSLGSVVQAGVVLDNTAGGTGTLSGTLGSLTTARWNFKVFTVGTSNVQITQQTMGLYESSSEEIARNITFALYGVDGNNDPTGTALASDTQEVTLPGGGGSSADFYTFNTGGTLAAYTLQAGQTYGILFSSDAPSTTLSWADMASDDIYTASEGFTFVANKRTTNSGSSYSDNGYYNAWSMTTTGGGGASVPEPTSLSMIGLGAIGVGIRSRKRLKASVKKALRRD